MSHPGYLLFTPLPGEEARGPVEFLALRVAVRHAGELLRQEWSRLASGVVVNRFTGAYLAGLRTPESFQYPYADDTLAVGIFNVAKHAGPIEYGYDGFNLAQRIRWGQTPKSRVSKKGRWYIYVPFRHYTPATAGSGATHHAISNAMTPAIYEVAKRLRPGERLTADAANITHGARPTRKGGAVVGVRGRGRRGSLLAPTTERAIFDMKRPRRLDFGNGRTGTKYPGQVKSPQSLAAATATGSAPNPMRVEASIYEGLFKSGGKGHRQYMTLRTITQDSQWWIPARPGAFVARQVADRMQPVVQGMLQEAFQKDVERGLRYAFGGGM